MTRILSVLLFSAATSLAFAAAHTAAPSETMKSPSKDQAGTTDANLEAKTSVERARDTSNHTSSDKADNQKPRGKTGSAAGVTGGPAATGGHTGSTSNPSNSPNK